MKRVKFSMRKELIVTREQSMTTRRMAMGQSLSPGIVPEQEKHSGLQRNTGASCIPITPASSDTLKTDLPWHTD